MSKEEDDGLGQVEQWRGSDLEGMPMGLGDEVDCGGTRA